MLIIDLGMYMMVNGKVVVVMVMEPCIGTTAEKSILVNGGMEFR